MEGQRQERVGDVVREIIRDQIREIIREMGELEERWQGLNLQPEDRRAQSQGVNLRILRLVALVRPVYFDSFPSEEITELGERCERFPQQLPSFTWLQAFVIPLFQLRQERVVARNPVRPTAIAISEEHISDSNSITSSCPICHDDFRLREEVGRFHCGHIFHQICIAPWITIANTCPVCRTEFQ